MLVLSLVGAEFPKTPTELLFFSTTWFYTLLVSTLSKCILFRTCGDANTSFGGVGRTWTYNALATILQTADLPLVVPLQEEPQKCGRLYNVLLLYILALTFGVPVRIGYRTMDYGNKFLGTCFWDAPFHVLRVTLIFSKM